MLDTCFKNPSTKETRSSDTAASQKAHAMQAVENNHQEIYVFTSIGNEVGFFFLGHRV